MKVNHVADLTAKLDVHVASQGEREAAYRNVHDVWSRGMSLDEHVRYRLHSPKHQSATWFVGCLDGVVVSSLGAYRVQLRLRGSVVPAVAIGSVHTLPSHRGRGLASTLLRDSESLLVEQGFEAGLLYSDIPTAFYERHGYATCPSFEGWRNFGDENALATAENTRSHSTSFVEFDPRDDLQRMARLYAEYHGRMNVAMVRDASYWRQLNLRGPNDVCFWLGSSERPDGYVRLLHDGRSLMIRDYALRGDRGEDELANALYGGVLAIAKRRAIERVGGWLPSTAAARRWFPVAPRAMAITMIKSFREDLEISADDLSDADHFCEIDHV